MTADASPAGSCPRVLVVDDNEPIADTYAAFLDDRYAVETAYSGTEALQAVDSTVDVVLLDRRMPDRSGDDVLEAVRAREFDCRVVMLTAVEPTFDIVDMPFDAYVVKPVGRAEVVDVASEMVERARHDDDLRRFLSLASKKAALEREHTTAQLRESEAYRRVERRMAELRDALGVDTAGLEDVLAGDVPDIAPRGACE